jgi:hypothetical protein
MVFSASTLAGRPVSKARLGIVAISSSVGRWQAVQKAADFGNLENGGKNGGA